jgi:quaternary ammonium compound-resistance protein SugE
MAWMMLLLAGLFEIAWAVGLKYAAGFTRLWPTVWTGLALMLSITLLSWSLRTLPIGTAYAIWTGVGAIGTAMLGIVLFGEPATAARIACIGLIVAGVIGLKVFAPGGA